MYIKQGEKGTNLGKTGKKNNFLNRIRGEREPPYKSRKNREK
jgi:hypothetical protein